MERVLTIIQLILTIASDIVEIIKNQGDRAGTIRLADLPHWEEWKKTIMHPDFTLLLDEFNKIKDGKQ
jgi:hypothetical protein